MQGHGQSMMVIFSDYLYKMSQCSLKKVIRVSMSQKCCKRLKLQNIKLKNLMKFEHLGDEKPIKSQSEYKKNPQYTEI